MKNHSRRFAHLSPDYDEQAAIQQSWADAFASVAAEQDPRSDPIAASWDVALRKVSGVVPGSRPKLAAGQPRFNLIRTTPRGAPL